MKIKTFTVLILTLICFTSFSQQLTLKDLKIIYDSESNTVLPYLKYKNKLWIDGKPDDLAHIGNGATWWTLADANKWYMSMAQTEGNSYVANLFILIESQATTKAILSDVNKSKMKSINESSTYTDGVYAIKFDVKKNDAGNNIWALTFAKREFFH